jgi:hypothetical protein
MGGEKYRERRDQLAPAAKNIGHYGLMAALNVIFSASRALFPRIAGNTSPHQDAQGL